MPRALSPPPTPNAEGVETDGWVKVHIEGEPERHGFVPASYVRTVAAPSFAPTPLRAAAPAPSPAPRSLAASVALPSEPIAGAGAPYSESSSPTAASAAASAAAASLLPEAGLPSATARSEALAGSRALAALQLPASAPVPWAASSLVPSAPGAAEEFSQLFASHEAWFKAAAAKRGEVYGALRAEADEVRRALAESEARSAAVLARLSELEALVAQERSRWAEGLQL